MTCRKCGIEVRDTAYGPGHVSPTPFRHYASAARSAPETPATGLGPGAVTPGPSPLLTSGHPVPGMTGPLTPDSESAFVPGIRRPATRRPLPLVVPGA